MSSGGTSFARATVIAEARSGPNQGFARPPFTCLRVVVTSSVGSAESDEASKRVPLAASPAHPPSASALASEPSPPQQRAAGRKCLVLQKMSDDHAGPPETQPVEVPPRQVP